MTAPDRADAIASLVARSQLARNPHREPQPYALVRMERLNARANATGSEINEVLEAAGYYRIYSTVEALKALLPEVLADMRARDAALVDGLLADLGIEVR